MAAQQFNLRWNNHTVNMLQILAENFEKESLVDVTISCQGKFIKAHKIVLGACSPQFQDIFDQHEAPHPVIIMNGVKYDDIRAIVEFMYKGEVKITESDLESLLSTAESLQVKGLSNVRATRPTSTPGQSNSSSNSHHGKQPTENHFSKSPTPLSENRNPDSGEKGQGSNNQLSSTISSSLLPHLNSSLSPARTQSTSSTSASSHVSGNNSDVESSTVTPVYLRRKRAKPSPTKDVNQNSCREREPKLKRKRSPATETVSTSVEDENSDDLPMTIKIDPPFIRDIDEDEDSDGGVRDGGNLESVDGSSDVKEIRTKRSLRMSAYPVAGIPEPKEKIPRPPNAFMIFANEWRRKLAIQFSNESNKEISVRLGIMWKNLPSQKKEDYFASSRQANDDHKKKYPDYYYSPKEARMRKRWKIQQQQVNQMITSGQYNPVHLVKVYMDESEASSNRSSSKQPSSSPSSHKEK